MKLLLAFITVPLIEIGLFIQVGGFIGLWPTLLVVLLTALAGSYLVRTQGLRELSRLQQSLNDLSDPTETLASGAMILFAGALLLTPGFFTDAVGLALLVPRVRSAAYHWARKNIRVDGVSFSGASAAQHPPQGHRAASGDETVIDGTFKDLSDEKSPTHPPSGWTRH